MQHLEALTLGPMQTAGGSLAHGDASDNKYEGAGGGMPPLLSTPCLELFGRRALDGGVHQLDHVQHRHLLASAFQG